MLKFYCIKHLKLEVDDDREQLLQNLKRIAESLSNLREFEHDWAKICLCLLEEGINPEDGERDSLTIALKIEDIFTHSESLKLKVLVLKVICNILFQSDPARCLEFAKEGAHFTNEISYNSSNGGMRQYERFFDEVIKNLTEQMEYRIHNKFVFLECNPLTRAAKKTDELVRIKKSLRSSVIDKLTLLNKKLVLDFDVLTEKRFMKLFCPENGCKLLVIDFEQPADPSGLLLEDNDLGEKIFSEESILRLIDNPDNAMNVDILILMNSQGKEYVEYFNKSNVKIIVYFEIPSATNAPSEYEIFERFWIEEFKIAFLNKFIDEFSQNKYAINCIEQARIEAIESLTHRVETETTLYNTVKNSWKEESIKVENPQMVPSFDKFGVKFVASEEFGYTIKCNLAKSDTIEESNQTSSEVIIPPIYLRRDKQLLELVKLLKTRAWINLTGQIGVGKTFLIRLLANTLDMRNTYPDGVFIFELRNMSSTDSIRSAMKDKLGDDFYSDTQTFFKDKKMLIIFDSYERVLKKELIEPRHVIECLKSSHISTIFVNRSSGPDGLLMPDTDTVKVEPLTPEESLLLLLSLQAREKTFFRFADGSVEKLSASSIIVKSKGMPSSIISHASKFFHNEMSADYFPIQKLLTKGSMTSPYIDHETRSMALMDYSDDRSLLDMSTGKQSTMKHSASGANNKKGGKPSKNAESKKDGKHSKYKSKVKNKKEMN